VVFTTGEITVLQAKAEHVTSHQRDHTPSCDRSDGHAPPYGVCPVWTTYMEASCDLWELADRARAARERHLREAPLPAGTIVAYTGSLTGHHGAYTVAGWCECPRCQDSLNARYELHDPDSGGALTCVHRSSIQPADDPADAWHQAEDGHDLAA
jgi:hypothetical protein